MTDQYITTHHAGYAMVESDILFNGHYQQVGTDLWIKGEDHKKLVLEGYFNNPTHLSNGEGAVLTPDMVQGLANAGTTLLVAQTTPENPVIIIGTVEKTEGLVTVQRLGQKLTLKVGDSLQLGDIIETGENGITSLVLADDTQFSIVNNSRMILDEFVYEPTQGQGDVTISVIKGAFSFISGQAAGFGPDSMQVTTPVGTIGIRGTRVIGELGLNGQTISVILLPENDGTVGQISFANASGQVILTEALQGISGLSFQSPPEVIQFQSLQEIQNLFGVQFEQLNTLTQPDQTRQNNAVPDQGNTFNQPSSIIIENPVSTPSLTNFSDLQTQSEETEEIENPETPVLEAEIDDPESVPEPDNLTPEPVPEPEPEPEEGTQQLTADQQLIVNAGTEYTLIIGSEGNDILAINQDALVGTVLGNGGADFIRNSEGGSLMEGGRGNDTIYGGINSSTIYGGGDQDHLYAGSAGDNIYGDGSDDVLIASGGSGSQLFGGEGNDNLSAENGSLLFGGNGDDILSGEGNSQFFGDEGNDIFILSGLPSSRVINGGAGQDTLDFSSNTSGITVNSTGNTDNISNVEILIGGNGADTLSTNLFETIYGGDGQDILFASENNEILYGDNGDDTFILNNNTPDNYTLEGGQGVDTIRLDANDLNLDFVHNLQTPEWNNIEVIDLGDSNASLAFNDIVSLTDDNNIIVFTGSEGTIDLSVENNNSITTEFNISADDVEAALTGGNLSGTFTLYEVADTKIYVSENDNLNFTTS